MCNRIVFALALLPAVAGAQNKTWTTKADFDSGALTQVADTPVDQVQLGPIPVVKTSQVWACHTANSMVVRLDTNTGKQTGRYDSALTTVNGQPTGAAPEFGCNYPRRVAVDANGDVWIPNAQFCAGQGTLTKFSGDISHCVDRNHNGKIDTSVDANGDGVINTFDPAEFFGQNDECILTTIPIPAPNTPNTIPRGVAIDRNGKVWVSHFNTGLVQRFNPAEPLALEANVQVSGNPYSLSTGGQWLFVGNSGGGFATRINIDTLQVQQLNGCPAFYGSLAAHPSGDKAYFGSYQSNGFVKADFANNTCTLIPAGNPLYTVSMDAQGNIWGANISFNYIIKLSPNDVVLGTFPLPGTAHGSSVDFNGFMWFSGYSLHNMYKVDPNTGAVVGTYSYDGPAGMGIDYTSYLYSDFTGYQIYRQAPYRKFGNWSATFDGGASQVPWSKVTWNAEQQGAVPAGTTLKVFARASDDVNTLPTIGLTPLVSGAALNKTIVGRFIQVEADMTGPGYLTPILSDVTVTGACNQRGDACCLADADCNDNNACTTDLCPTPGAACTHTLKQACCNVDADCNSNNACMVDTCSGAGGTCTHTPKQACCNVNADCGDGNLCTTDVCSGQGGTCTNTPIQGCCNANKDCASGNPCSIDLCSGPGGKCSHFAKANCCLADGDCDDQDACTADSCPKQGGMCSHVKQPGCCNVDADCDDGNACHTFTCSGPGGTCTYAPVAGCCNVNADCDDQDACTADVCSGPGGACVHTAIQGCCNVDGDCDDKNPCTKDTCSGKGGACGNAKIDGCCVVDSDCDSHDVCTVDTCANGSCAHAPKGNGCCTMDTDCDDKNACTADTCANGAMCAHAPVPGCCNLDPDCQGGYCLNHQCMNGMQPNSDGGGGPNSNVAATGGCGCALGARPPAHAAWALFGLLLVAAVGYRRARW